MRSLAALIALSLPGYCAAADKICAPARMLKVVTTIDAPDISDNHFVHEPKTLYRLGEGKGRVEESKNPESGLHLLIVVDEPHIWIVNLAQRQGQYQHDPGPTFYFRARIFDNTATQSSFIRSLEIGCEVAWMREAGAKATSTVHPGLGAVSKLEFVENQERLVLFEQNGKPISLELYGPAGWAMTMNYLAYESDLKPKQQLFTKPAGITFSYEESGT